MFLPVMTTSLYDYLFPSRTQNNKQFNCDCWNVVAFSYKKIEIWWGHDLIACMLDYYAPNILRIWNHKPVSWVLVPRLFGFLSRHYVIFNFFMLSLKRIYFLKILCLAFRILPHFYASPLCKRGACFFAIISRMVGLKARFYSMPCPLALLLVSWRK